MAQDLGQSSYDTICPLCETGEHLRWERGHYRCRQCGFISPCCQGMPQNSS